MKLSLAGSSFVALVALVSLGAGCAQERAPINRVQPNAFDKHFFVGADIVDPADDPEFYWRNYVVDASASQSLVGVGSWGHVDRVRWEITENLLLARKAYQIADGEDDKGTKTNAKGFAKTPNGTVVAAYKISSHFDIRRSYNPQTGEELNIVEENASDRPWNLRDYMRIDWSMNLVDNPMWEDVFTAKVLGELTITPIAYYVNDPSSDDAPHIDSKDGYLDITNKYFVAPAQSDSPFLDLPGKAPTCLLYGIYTGNATYECDAQEATVRASYWRIDPNHDFEPLDNTRATLDVVGNPGGIGNSWSVGVVSAGRQGWDPQYGFTDALYHRFAYIHNLWKKSHQTAGCDANADDDHDGTADQCSNDVTGWTGSSGSQCDVFTKRCTIPYRDREIKTVGYWINKEAPDDLLDPTDASGRPAGRGSLEDLVFAWNQLQTVAVAYAREVECRRTGGSRDECHAETFESTADPATKQMVSYGGWLVDVPVDKTPTLTFCHNPVRAYDLHDTCGQTGELARVGDIRKNFVFYWPYESRAPWGGIANWNADPLTGEIIGAAAAIMGRSATFAAAQQRDVIQLAMGDVKLDDVITGVPATTFSKTLVDGHAPTALTKEQIASRVAAVDLKHLNATIGSSPTGVEALGPVLADLKARGNSVADPSMLSTSMLEFNALAAKLRGTTHEAQLVDPHWLVDAAGASPRTIVDDATLNVVSPLRALDPGKMQAFRALMTERLRARGACYLDHEAPALGSVYLTSLAGWFKSKYGGLDKVERGRAIYADLWKEAVKGIGLHEIGHSLGMLHQFASSWDSLNYNPQYWQLRTNEGASTKVCDGPRTGDVDSCMGPRYLDPPTRDELGLAGEPRPGIDYFGNTSTMEYQIERGGETVGLGTYDLHTMKALYGRVLETFDSSVHTTAQQQAFKFKLWTQLTERDILLDGQLGYRHYTSTARLAKVFDAKRDCRDATDDEKATAGWRVVHGKVCAPQPKDHWRWDEMLTGELLPGQSGFSAPFWHAKDNEGRDRVRWPYRWGTGHNSYFHDNDSDAGADPYEVAINTTRRFDATYPWTYFRRQNKEYNYRRIASRVSDGFFDRMRSYHWLVATDLSRASNPVQLQSDDDLRPYVVAETEMFDLLARAVLMPEPGPYYSPARSADVFNLQPVDATKPIFDAVSGLTGKPDFTIGIVDGRFVGEEFDNDLGGSWDYLHWIRHAGFSVEKERAIEALVDGRPTLFTISRENFLDGRGVKINFRNDLPSAVDRLVGGILAEDWESIGLHATVGSANPSPEMLDLTRAATPVRPQGAQILFPNIGYKQQLSTAMFVALFSRLSADMTLVDKMRVWVEGQVGGVDVPDAEQIRFTDPASGYTYVARTYGPDVIDGRTVDKGIASRMLAHANALLAVAYVVERDALGAVVRDAYGRPKLVLGADGRAQTDDRGVVRFAQLGKYVGLLNAVREIGYKLGYGPLGGPVGE